MSQLYRASFDDQFTHSHWGYTNNIQKQVTESINSDLIGTTMCESNPLDGLVFVQPVFLSDKTREDTRTTTLVCCDQSGNVGYEQDRLTDLIVVDSPEMCPASDIVLDDNTEMFEPTFEEEKGAQIVALDSSSVQKGNAMSVRNWYELRTMIENRCIHPGYVVPSENSPGGLVVAVRSIGGGVDYWEHSQLVKAIDFGMIRVPRATQSYLNSLFLETMDSMAIEESEHPSTDDTLPGGWAEWFSERGNYTDMFDLSQDNELKGGIVSLQSKLTNVLALSYCRSTLVTESGNATNNIIALGKTLGTPVKTLQKHHNNAMMMLYNQLVEGGEDIGEYRILLDEYVHRDFFGLMRVAMFGGMTDVIDGISDDVTIESMCDIILESPTALSLFNQIMVNNLEILGEAGSDALSAALVEIETTVEENE